MLGNFITEADICVKRNNAGLPAKVWDFVVGTKANKYYKIDEGIEF